MLSIFANLPSKEKLGLMLSNPVAVDTNRLRIVFDHIIKTVTKKIILLKDSVLLKDICGIINNYIIFLHVKQCKHIYDAANLFSNLCLPSYFHIISKVMVDNCTRRISTYSSDDMLRFNPRKRFAFFG